MKRKRQEQTAESSRELEDEWKCLKKEDMNSKKDFSVAERIENLGKNRYSDILALSTSRVILRYFLGKTLKNAITFAQFVTFSNFS